MFVSYAQNFEDVILHRALKSVEKGFYIDIGAQEPVIDSVSLAFYELGWRGVHVEPNGLFAAKLRAARTDETVLELAIGAATGVIPFFESADTGLSTAVEAIAAVVVAAGRPMVRREIACLKMSAFLDRYQDRDIHWLKIDVEGFEKNVVDGWRPSAVRPWIVVVEATRPQTSEPAHAAWEQGLLSLGYEFVYFDGLNRFYTSDLHPELKAHFGPGPNIFDAFVVSGMLHSPKGQEIVTALHAAREEAARHARALASLGARAERGANAEMVGPPWLGAFERALLRLPFHSNGRPRRLIRRLMFDTRGAVRRPFRRWVYDLEGRARAPFQRWLARPPAARRKLSGPLFRSARRAATPVAETKLEEFLDRDRIEATRMRLVAARHLAGRPGRVG